MKFQLILVFLNIKQHHLILMASLVMQGLPVTIVVNAAPRYGWPVIIKLPIQCTHAIGPTTTMCLNTVSHSLTLQNKTNIYKILEFCWNNIVISHILLNSGVSNARFLMLKHHSRINIIITRRSECCYCFHFRKTLKSIFTHKTRNNRIQNFKHFMTMPETPVMRVTTF